MFVLYEILCCSRSEEEKTRHLLEGVAKEVELEASQPTPEQDIALRSEIEQVVQKNVF